MDGYLQHDLYYSEQLIIVKKNFLSDIDAGIHRCQFISA